MEKKDRSHLGRTSGGEEMGAIMGRGGNLKVKIGKKEYLQRQKRRIRRGELIKLREGKDGTKSTSTHSLSI